MEGTPPCSIGLRTEATDAWDPARLRGEAWLEVHCHVLRLEELLEALVASLAADPGLLHATERCSGVRDHSLVEADHAGLEALADADGPLDVAGEQVGHQAVLGVVRALDRLLLGV